ncbi:hypothetical protein DPMN_013606 [Dreissena polymorpha]|uniref:Uncharacterized protein n=1 Tax=Dreissena polymorpha TaxID=45954 RepID=A0A9D4S4G8_DREPO|nr:hypothetical protein DPMN_013606 [Dreissena polymorpha]
MKEEGLKVPKTNVLTKFHEKIYIYILTGDHVFQQTRTIFEHIQDIIKSVLIMFHEDRTINVTLRVKNALHPVDIIVTNFHEDQTINEASRRHLFQATTTIFVLVQDIVGTNLLTMFYDNRITNVTFRVFTRLFYGELRKIAPPHDSHFHEDWNINPYKKCPATGHHVFQPTRALFELVLDIIDKHILTRFHEYRTINVASSLLTSHVFQQTRTIFELVHDITRTNVLTKKNAGPPGSDVCQPTRTIFKHVQDINRKNLLTFKFRAQTVHVSARDISVTLDTFEWSPGQRFPFQLVHVSGLLLISPKTHESTQVDPSQPESTQVNPSRPKSIQVDPSQPKSTQVNPSRPKSTQVDPSRPKWTQVNLSQPKSTQVNPSRPKSIQVNPSQPKSTQVNPSQPK